MAAEVSCSTGLSRIWLTGNNTSQSKTAIPLCQTLYWVFHKDRCWALYSFFCISMTCIDSQIRCVLFILLMIQQFFASDSDINNVHATVNRELVGVDNWLKANRLSLNISKTSYMIISNQKTAIEIRIRDSIITKVSTVKFLGVTLDLTFNDHVKNVTTKISKSANSCYEEITLPVACWHNG